jgi:hypothetical protein
MKKCILFVFIAAITLKTHNSFGQLVPVNKLDSMALVNLYDSAGGKQWYHNTGWLVGPVSTWYDVTVTGTRVTSISLYFNNLIGVLPYTIGNLTALQTLEISKNQLSGSVPSSLGNLSVLSTLDLSQNDLSDSIPSTLAQLKAVSFVSLASDQFTFSGMEGLVKAFSTINFTYDDQADIPLHFINNKFSVSAGGGLGNNTYNWYKGSTLVATNTGDSLFPISATGSYSVIVTNAVATGLTLYSDTIVVSSLAVADINFIAEKAGNQNLLTWTVGNETDCSSFSIERSSNGENFTTIGNISIQENNNNAETSYSYIDTRPSNGTNYYRLRMNNKDGSYIYGEIKSINNIVNFIATVYPNPVQSNLNLNFSNAVAGNAQVEIVNAEGKIVLSKQIRLTEGTSTQTFNTSSLSNGTYYVRLITQDGETGLEFLKMR